MKVEEAIYNYKALYSKLSKNEQATLRWFRFYDQLGVLQIRLKNEDVSIDDMTPNTWNAMSKEERQAWKTYWQMQGHVSFCCLKCGFPTSSGRVGCEACRPEKKEPTE